MPVAGDTHTPSLDVTGGGTATGGTLLVVDGADAAGVPVTCTPVDGGLRLTAPPVLLHVPGEWRLMWAVSDPDARVTQVLYVAPAPGDTPDGFSFATTADLARYTGAAPAAGDRRRLIDASREIERITKTAVYPVRADGRPADPLLRAAFADATCELVGWWAETGTETGGAALYTSASIAGVSLGMGGANTQNPQADRVGPKVWTMLMAAGLVTPGAVVVRG